MKKIYGFLEISQFMGFIKNNPFNQIPNPTNSQLIKPYDSKIQTLIGSNLILIPINPLHRITSSEKQQTEEEKI
jgi:hypothetical protein